MPDIFEQLLPATFRDVHFPVTEMGMRLRHDLVRHSYWGVDGARVEDTGMAPIEFTFTVPWSNFIVPGRNELWEPGKLYPTAMRALLVAFARKDTGILQHPEFGEISVKADSMELTWSGNRRGGCDCSLSFVETIIDGDVAFVEFPSPVQDIEVAAADLDANDADLRALVPTLPVYPQTFADFARQLTAVVDQATLLSQRSAGKIDAIMYRVNEFQGAIDRARSAKTWPATQAIQRIKAAGHNLRQKLLEAGRDIVLYRVPGDTTIAGLMPKLGDTNLGDVIKLNPRLMASPVVPSGTVIRYYVPRKAA